MPAAFVRIALQALADALNDKFPHDAGGRTPLFRDPRISLPARRARTFDLEVEELASSPKEFVITVQPSKAGRVRHPLRQGISREGLADRHGCGSGPHPQVGVPGSPYEGEQLGQGRRMPATSGERRRG